MILRWTFLSFSLFSLLGFLLQVQAKENAALMLPQFPKGISKQDQQILILNLEQELSTRFNLLSKEVVNESFRKAIASLPGDECTEDNCILKMQEDLKINLIFNFGILKSDLVTVMTLRLTDGAKKLVRTEVCAPPCDLENQIDLQKNIVQSLLSQRDQDKSPSNTGEPGIILSKEKIILKEGSDSEVLSVKLAASPSQDVTLEWESKPEGLMVIEPKKLIFSPQNWDQFQKFRVYAVEDSVMGKDTTGEIEIFSSSETKDMNYSFSSPKKKVSFSFLDNDQKGILKINTFPQEAEVFIDGKPFFDDDGNQVLSGGQIELEPGKRSISIKKLGFMEVTRELEVNRKRLGTWFVNLRPRLSEITIRVPYRYSDSEIYINGKPMLSMEGSNKVSANFPAGRYEIQAISSTDISSIKLIELTGEETQEIYFEGFSSKEGFVERSVKTLGVTEAFFGPQTEILISRSSDGPLKYVSWNIPGIIYGLKGDRQDIEIFGSQGSGSTETFTASQGGEDYVINSVSVQKFGMAYVYKNLRPIKLKAGLSQTSLQFSSSSKSFKYSYPAASAGLGIGMNMSEFLMDAAANFSTKGEGSINAGISYLF